MSSPYTVARYLIDRLKEAGVDHIFGVPGDYAFPLLDTIEDHPGMTWVGSCNELNAVYSADGYARTRGLAAVTGSCGVLELGAAAGIAGAYSEWVPILIIAGFPGMRELETNAVTHHSVRGQFEHYRTMLAPVTADQFFLTSGEACNQIDQAIRTCWALKAPVYLQFPRDVQQLPAEPPTSRLSLPEPQSDSEVLEHFLAEAIPLLNNAKSPAILVDYLASRYGLTELIESLSEVSGIPYATTLDGRSGEMNQTRAGYIGYYRSPPMSNECSVRIDEADILLRVCPKHDETNLGSADPAQTGARYIDLQGDSASIGPRYYSRLSAADVLKRLSKELPHRKDISANHPKPTIGPFEPKPDTPLTQDAVLAGFNSFVRENDTLAVDYGTANSVTQLTLSVRTRDVTQTNWAAIGYTTAAIVGVGLADPAVRIIQFVGDGAFHETAQEVSTIIHHKVRAVTFLLNNTRYQIENVTHTRGPVDKRYNDVPNWRYSEIPKVMGPGYDALGIRVTTEEELAAALVQAEEASKQGRYVLIEAVLRPTDLSTVMVDYFTPSHPTKTAES